MAHGAHDILLDILWHCSELKKETDIETRVDHLVRGILHKFVQSMSFELHKDNNECCIKWIKLSLAYLRYLCRLYNTRAHTYCIYNSGRHDQGSCNMLVILFRKNVMFQNQWEGNWYSQQQTILINAGGVQLH